MIPVNEEALISVELDLMSHHEIKTRVPRGQFFFSFGTPAGTQERGLHTRRKVAHLSGNDVHTSGKKAHISGKGACTSGKVLITWFKRWAVR